MTDKLLIKREQLERIDETAICDGTDATISDDLFTQLVAALAAPRQPEVDAISRERVQAEADAFFDWPTADKSSVTTTSCLIFARCIAGMVAAERDATIAELREECEHLKACQENDMLHMTGLMAERDTLRQQLAERDAEILEQCRLNGMGAERELKLLTQRDKLAGLLRDERTYGAMPMSCQIGMVEVCHCSRCRFERIDAALAEVDK